MKEQLPYTGFKGILHHWKDDLSAAVSVALVALPLALGIAIASGVPPMSGLLAAIIGGVVTTFFRGSYVAINGPAAGLIVVVLAGVESLADAGGTGFRYVLAAVVVAGVIQALLGLLKLGKLGDLFPMAVINGMLATIGITIFVKQFHVALGVNSLKGNIVESIQAIPESIFNLNPLVTLIAVISILILVFHPRIHINFIKSIPAPLLVLLVVVPMVFIINYFGSSEVSFLGKPIYISTDYLIQIPADIRDSIVFPDFSKINEPAFWLVVISILLVASIETLISAKAVDKLDHYKRRTDLNKDLLAMGISSTVSGFLGGLPIITVIVRSSVNVSHNAKTKWSNLYHGLLLMAFVFLFPVLINEIPLACLAAILVYTGYKLASPRLFRDMGMKGWEQLLVFIITIIASLAFNLLWGILIGIIATLMVQWVRSKLNLKTFVRHMINTEVDVVEESGEVMHVEIRGIANFAMILKLINSFNKLGNDKHSIVNFSHTKLIDSTVLEFIHEHREKYFTETDLEFVGLGVHNTSSSHPLALHVLEKPMQKPLTGRQNELYHYAKENQYRFNPEIEWEVDHYEKFSFFEFHLIEYHRNRLSGTFDGNISWVISDLTFNDGILIAREEHHLTIMYINFPDAREFLVTKEDVRHLKTLLRKGKKDKVLPEGFSEVASFICNEASFYIESKSGNILLYRKERLLSTKEIRYLHDFAEGLCKRIPQKNN